MGFCTGTTTKSSLIGLATQQKLLHTGGDLRSEHVEEMTDRQYTVSTATITLAIYKPHSTFSAKNDNVPICMDGEGSIRLLLREEELVQ